MNAKRNRAERPTGLSSRLRKASGRSSTWIAPNGQAVRLPVILDLLSIDPENPSRRWLVEARVDLVGTIPLLVSVNVEGSPCLDSVQLQRFFRWATPIEVVQVTVPQLLDDGVDPYEHDYTNDGYPEEAIEKERERFHIVADYTYDWEMWVDSNGQLLYVSPSCERISGYTQEEFLADANLSQTIIDPEDRIAYSRLNGDTEPLEAAEGIEYRIRTKAGNEKWIEQRRTPVVTDDGRYLGYRISNRDFTERKAAEAKVEFLAMHDALTLLPIARPTGDRLGGCSATEI